MSTEIAPRRCPVHGLVLMNGSSCVRCHKQAAARSTSQANTRSLVSLIAVLLAGGALAIVLHRPKPAPTPTAIVAMTPPPPAPPPAPAVAPRPLEPAHRLPPGPGFPKPTLIVQKEPDPQADADEAERQRELDEYVARARALREKDENSRWLHSVSITMYSTSWCGVCANARRWFAQKGFAYTEHDVEREPAARERQRQLNPRLSVPVFEVDGQPLVGFTGPVMMAAITSAANQRARR